MIARDGSRAPVLVLGSGNPGRGDDALGPLLIAALDAAGDARRTEFIASLQLQIEHMLDLVGRELLLFIDASVQYHRPCCLTEVHAVRDHSYSSHVLTPGALLAAFELTLRRPAPPAFVLALGATRFDLGAPLSATAESSLACGHALAHRLLARPALRRWRAWTRALEGCSAARPTAPVARPWLGSEPNSP